MTEQQTPPSKFQVRLPLILAATLAAGMFIGQQLPHYDNNVRFLPVGPEDSAVGSPTQMGVFEKRAAPETERPKLLAR